MNISKLLQKKINSTPAAKHWERVGVKHHHGVNIPLFSIYTEQSAGIGEYLDLLHLIPWCQEVGMNVIQLLPLNDGGHDKSPYNALSAFALNPVHLSIADLPRLHAHKKLLVQLKDLQKLNAYPRVAYDTVRVKKEKFMKAYLEREGEEIRSSKEYKQFLSHHASWLHSYAAFKVLKETQKWHSWMHWPKKYRDPTHDTIEEIISKHRNAVDRYITIQFLCFEQMQRVKTTAENQGIYIKGDIPILISRDSADVWLHRKLFRLDLSAGTPPDVFNSKGQNWNFPIYNWREIEEGGDTFWKERLQVASHLYHIYRIDHFVGFFRIWSIARGASPTQGQFVPKDPSTWITHGERIMKIMLHDCEMLPIGEDLGVVPANVRTCMEGLGICGTKVMRLEREWDEDGRFISTDEYSALSMTTVSTHDAEPLQMWWESHPDEARALCNHKRWGYHQTLSKPRLEDILLDSHQSKSLFHINLLHEYLPLFPELCWPNPEDDRINRPGIVHPRNWTIRFRRPLEELLNHVKLKNKISSFTK